MTNEWIKIGDIANVKGGKRLPKGHELIDEVSDHPYLRIVDFDKNGLDTSNIKYLTDDTFERISRYTISSNDIYISIAGTIGRVGIIPKKFDGANLTENAAKISDISARYSPEYLLYYLRSHRGQATIKSKAGGTSQPKLALYKIEEIEFPDQPKSVQQKIINKIRPIDEFIENNRRRIALLEESARLLYREWFVHFRFYGACEGCSNIKLPVGWKLAQVKDKLAKVKNKQKIKKEDFRAEGPYPCVDQSKTFIGGYTDNQEAIYRNELPLVVFGDHTRCVKYIDFEFARGADGTQICKSNDPNFSDVELYLAIKEIDLSNYFYARHFKFLKDQKLVIPDAKTSENFRDLVAPIYMQISNLRKQIANAVKARDLLLPRLMDGRIAV